MIEATIALLVSLGGTGLHSAQSPITRTEGGNYVVLVDPGTMDEFLPAAKELAEFHRARVMDFDPARLEEAFEKLQTAKPDFVVFVLPPEKIDVDLVHQILARATAL